MSLPKVIVTVSGPLHSQKKHLISLINKTLSEHGVNSKIIGGEDHLNGKDKLSKEQLSDVFTKNKTEVLILDQQTT